MRKVNTSSGSRKPSRLLVAAGVLALLLAPAVNAAAEIAPGHMQAPSEVSPAAPDASEREKSGKQALKLDYSGTWTGLHIVLPPPSEEENASMERADSKRTVIGFHRKVSDAPDGDLSAELEWSEQPDGTFVSSLKVTSPGAASLRAGIRAELTPGGEIRFFGEESDETFPVVTSEDFYVVDGEIQTLWSPTVDGDSIGIEISLPSQKAVDAFWIVVDRVAHSPYSTSSFDKAMKRLECPSIHIDAQCAARSIHGNLEDATARIRFEDGGSYVCSGTLMNDTVEGSTIPYFLTANHCVDAERVARSVEAWWWYQRASCGSSSVDRRYTRTTGGLTLLSTSESYDATLLRFLRSVPGGLTLSGWTETPLSHPVDVYGIHHPDGDLKKYSEGTTRGSGFSDGVRDAIAVRWSRGTTEGGSSGSGLFLESTGQLVGMLSHGPVCGHNITDYYGPFREFLPQIGRWLDPDGAPPIGEDHGDTIADASLIQAPATIAASLERGGDVDVFRFELATEGTVRVYTTGGTDTLGTLTRAGSSFRVRDDDSGDLLNFSITAQGAQPGTYYVQVPGFRTSTTGTYTLHVVTVGGALGAADVVLPLITEADNRRQQGFVRVINASTRSGVVRIDAVDDMGRRFGPAALSLAAGQSRNFNSRDLERGNASVGVHGGVGSGTGNWRVELRADFDIQARAYIRTPDGFLTAMHSVSAETSPGSQRYHVPFFNPGSNTSLRSLLRVVNPSTATANVTISGIDAEGNAAPRGDVRFNLLGGRAVLLSAQGLEQGVTGARGRFGTGQGKWQLYVSSNQPLLVMGLMLTRSDHLSNLSE